MPDQAKPYPWGSTSVATCFHRLDRLARAEPLAAALPVTWAAGKPLKCGTRSGPVTYLVVTTADSGTIWPLFDLV